MRNITVWAFHQTLKGHEEDEIGMARSTNGQIKNTYNNLIGKSNEKIQHEKMRYTWEDNTIKMDLQGIF
jgi:hypothetical protein